MDIRGFGGKALAETADGCRVNCVGPFCALRRLLRIASAVAGRCGRSSMASGYHIPEEEKLGADELRALQGRKFEAMLRDVMAGNRFYQRKLDGLSFDAERDGIEKLPLTTRKELERDQEEHPPFGSNLTYGLEQYCRFHQTSGSSGRPMRWLDTAQSWDWFKKCWGIIFAAAGVGEGDRVAFPFSFGPFVGFWGAFDGATSRGLLALPAGGMTTTARLKMIVENDVTVVCCTPTYALRMVEVAHEERIDVRGSNVKALIVAGEPGGHILETRKRIEEGWGARLFDHTGMTEIGPLGFECMEDPGAVHLMENECIAEVIDPQTLRPVADGQVGELIITNLGRWGSPVIRYRTGDQVKLSRGRCACGRSFARMEGGILGRLDEMIIVRGNNVFPSVLEGVVRRFTEVAEFRIEAYDEGPLTQVRVDVEPADAAADVNGLAARVGQAIQDALSFRVEVRTVSPGSLPRFEMKARRFVRRK